MTSKVPNDLIDGWIEFQKLEADSPLREEYLWAEIAMSRLVTENPEEAYSVIEQIANYATDEWILGALAAGPLEDLLSEHGERMVSYVESSAKDNKKFRQLLRGVWQGGMSEDVWSRIQSASSE